MAEINAQTAGAVGDGVTDDTVALQAAMDAVTSAGGGTLFLPSGTYRVTAPLVVHGKDLLIRGVGKRNIQTPLSGFNSTTVASTLFLDHAGSGIVLSHANAPNGFRALRLTVAGDFSLAASSRPARAFAFDLGGNGTFMRDFVFEEVSITGCRAAFELFESSAESGTSEGAVGVVRIVRCSVQHNVWIARTATGKHFNSFVFHENEAGQNGYQSGEGGIDVTGQNVSICDNVLEATRDTVHIRELYQSMVVRNNYFEANVGDFCIKLDGVLGPWVVGPNSYGQITATHKVMVVNSTRGVSHDPAWTLRAVNAETPEPGGAGHDDLTLNNGASDAYVRLDTRFSPFTRPPVSTAVVHGYEGDTEALSPLDGTPIPVKSGTTSGTGVVSIATRTISVPAGQWLVACVAFRRRSSSSADPYFVPLLNGTPTGAGPIYYVDVCVRTGDWMLVTYAVKAGSAATTAALELYPYGLSPATGLAWDVRPPILYVAADINDVRPYFDPWQARRVSAAPTGGTWTVGTRLALLSPTAGGYEDVVRVSTGAWKQGGLIQT